MITDGELRLLEGISELTGIFLENGQLYRDAESANRAKDEFLATLSHELRTPLTPILAWITILEKDRSRATVDAAVQTLGRNARVLAQLIEDLLDVSRIVAGKLELVRERLDGRDVLRAARYVMEFRPEPEDPLVSRVQGTLLAFVEVAFFPQFRRRADIVLHPGHPKEVLVVAKAAASAFYIRLHHVDGMPIFPVSRRLIGHALLEVLLHKRLHALFLETRDAFVEKRLFPPKQT